QRSTRLAPLDGPLVRAAARHVRRPPRATGGPRRRPSHRQVLQAEPRAARPGRGARGPGDDVKRGDDAKRAAEPVPAMKPEELLKLIAGARAHAICVPTMTTAAAVAAAP